MSPYEIGGMPEGQGGWLGVAEGLAVTPLALEASLPPCFTGGTILASDS
jgi:hypothetical protein